MDIFCWCKNNRKSPHLITTAILPLHGFLNVSLAKKQACFIKSLHWANWGRNISQNCAIKTTVSKPQKWIVHFTVNSIPLLYKFRYVCNSTTKQVNSCPTFSAVKTNLEYAGNRKKDKTQYWLKHIWPK